MYEGIINKKKFEDTYMTTYVSMHDYWGTLDYQERKHQMNVDIDQMRKELKSFSYKGEDIYIPMFDQRMNRLYTQEIVLMELKQYQNLMMSSKRIYTGLYLICIILAVVCISVVMIIISPYTIRT